MTTETAADEDKTRTKEAGLEPGGQQDDEVTLGNRLIEEVFIKASELAEHKAILRYQYPGGKITWSIPEPRDRQLISWQLVRTPNKWNLRRVEKRSGEGIITTTAEYDEEAGTASYTNDDPRIVAGEEQGGAPSLSRVDILKLANEELAEFMECLRGQKKLLETTPLLP